MLTLPNTYGQMEITAAFSLVWYSALNHGNIRYPLVKTHQYREVAMFQTVTLLSCDEHN